MTEGLLALMDQRQLRGVLAHEISHIQHRDTLVAAIAAALAGTTTHLIRRLGLRRGRDTLAIAVFLAATPLLALLFRKALHRSQEFLADARAARITGDPEGLALALEALAPAVQRTPTPAGLEGVHMVVHGFGGGIGQWFSTHPPIEDRIARLRALPVDSPAP